MRRCHAVLAASLLLPGGAVAGSFSATVASLVDASGSYGADVDVLFRPNQHVSMSAGAGHTTSSADFADLHGRALRAALDLHNDRLGARVGIRSWSDSSDYQTRTAAAEIYFRAGAFEFGLRGEDQHSDVAFSLTLANTLIERRLAVDGTGIGANITYIGGNWAAIASYTSYDFGRTVDRLQQALSAPQVDSRPRLAALIGSLLTDLSATVDRRYSLTLDRSFIRSGLRFDIGGVEDALDGSQAQSASVSWRYAMTPRWEVELTGGMSDGDNLDGVGFAGVALTLRN
ncbi:MAG: hypothetical protein R3E77_01310 [Steroidobacteraceae bacterium]